MHATHRRNTARHSAQASRTAPPPDTRTPCPILAVDEQALATAIGMSVAFLRKDRAGRRLIPFFRIGGPLRGAIRYDPEAVRRALAAMQEGGADAR